MNQVNRLSFLVGALPSGAATVMPCIDGIPLADLVAAFESSNKYDRAGGYGGLVPEYFKCGSLEKYFNGCSEDTYWQEETGGRIYLLGCMCGEVGCWPLEGAVEDAQSQIRWSNFHQPHRLDRDYTGFGPFIFDKTQYAEALRNLVAKISS